MSDHTPGPYTLSEDGRLLFGAGGKMICDVHGDQTTREEDRANAKRIAKLLNIYDRLDIFEEQEPDE